MEPTQLLNLSEDDRQLFEVASWLVNSCDTVVWTSYGRQPMVPGLLRSWTSHPEFKFQMEVLAGQFRGVTTDHLEYGHIEHTQVSFTHYSFDLIGPVQELILSVGPFVSFAGLWDPCYYRAGELIAASICHEQTLMLWTDLDLNNAL